MRFIHYYKWLLPSLSFSVLLIIVRIVYTGHLMFLFLLWNMFLAVVPLYMSYKLTNATTKRSGYMYVAVWLLFFPNAMYIVTDLFHLKSRTDIPLWFDLLLLLSAALNGVIMGFYSLKNIEQWMIGFINKKYMQLIVFALLLLCGYGIYLGRYERWNSWDVLVNPISLVYSIGHHVIHPFRNIDIWILSSAFAVWMYLLYRYWPVDRKSGL